MKTNKTELAPPLKAKLERIKKSISIKDYKTSANLMISVYEEAIKQLYKTYLGQLDNPGLIIQYINEITKSSKPNISTLQFGQVIGFLNKSLFLEELVEILKGDVVNSFKFDKKEFVNKINELNTIRNQDVHSNITRISEEFVRLNFEYLKLFLKRFGFDRSKEIPIEFGSLKTHKIVGEIQLYQSLNNVFNSENIDCLDATYFSAKIPKHQKHEEIERYWNEVQKRLKDGSLTLRRIISLSNEENTNIKLIWLLFCLIPKHYDYLNKTAFFGVFKTSRVYEYEDLEKSVQIVNLIIMYNRENPNTGHAWLFSAHTGTNINDREYLHLHGEDISIIKSIFNDMYLSSDKCDNNLIKEIISKKAKNSINADQINGIIDKLTLQKEIVFAKNDIDYIKEIYNKIYNDERNEEGFQF